MTGLREETQWSGEEKVVPEEVSYKNEERGRMGSRCIISGLRGSSGSVSHSPHGGFRGPLYRYQAISHSYPHHSTTKSLHPIGPCSPRNVFNPELGLEIFRREKAVQDGRPVTYEPRDRDFPSVPYQQSVLKFPFRPTKAALDPTDAARSPVVHPYSIARIRRELCMLTPP